jgi:STE24 endopeptidase
VGGEEVTGRGSWARLGLFSGLALGLVVIVGSSAVQSPLVSGLHRGPRSPLLTRPASFPPARSASAPDQAREYFDAPFLRRSEEYNRTRLSFGLNAQAIRWAVYLSLICTPFLPRLSSRLTRRFPRQLGLRVFLLGWIVLLILFVALLPISYASGFRLEHRYGLSRQSLASWLADSLKWLGLWGVFITMVTAGYFALRRRFPRFGWLPLAAGLALAAVAATYIYPVVIDPLFNRYRPLKYAALRNDLVAMARAEGIFLESVLVMEASAKTARENAYFTGFGRTKRVVLWDNLLTNGSPAEVRQIFAHELGHWSRGHITRGLALSLAALPLGCWLVWSVHRKVSHKIGRLEGPDDPAGVPLVWLLLSLLLMVSQPLSNAVSRSFEREADRVSLDLTRDPKTFIESERRLTVTNLGWVDPPRVWHLLFGSHPSTMERIRMAEAWRDARRRTPPEAGAH